MSSLISLYNSTDVNRPAKFARTARELDTDELVQWYDELLDSAPRRHERGKFYLSGRTGVTSSKSHSNRHEEHLAVALYNASRAGKIFTLPDGRRLEILDYQTPLKARRNDAGIGKIDLFGCLAGTQPCVIELKVSRPDNALADTPLRAVLEGLAYCAIAEANGTDVAAEALKFFDRRLRIGRPTLLVMAPSDYWLAYLGNDRIGDWLPVITDFLERLQKALSIQIELISLIDSGFEMGLDGKPAYLTGDCRLETIDR